MPEEPSSESNLPLPPKGPIVRRRRGRRGGRGRRRPARPVPPLEDQAAPVSPSAEPIESVEPAEAPKSFPDPARQPVTSAPPPEKEFEGSAISQAVSEVTHIIEGLRQSLVQMEEVLELVELAERQKLTDEREIDSLRRALRRIHHPRGEHSHPDE
jgi:hypothetical protein